MPILRCIKAKLQNGNGDEEIHEWIEKLMVDGKIRTFEDLLMCNSLNDLSKDCNIPYEVLDSWTKIIKIDCDVKAVTLFDEVNRVEQQTVFYSFGCEKFDQVYGGIRSGSITQISGDEASGKTQLCHSLTVQAVLHDQNVVYIDTESTFSGERIVNMIKKTARQASIPDLWDKIQVVKVFDVNALFQVLQEQDHSDTSVLILDSILGVLVPHVVQLGMIGEKQQQVMIIRELNKSLKYLALNYPGLAVVVTIGNLKWFTKYWGNVPSFKLHLKAEPLIMGKDVVRKIEVQKSVQNDLQKIFDFTIQNSGLNDTVHSP